MNKEFFEAIALLEKENGIPADYMYEKIKAAIISATKNSYGNRDNLSLRRQGLEMSLHQACYPRRKPFRGRSVGLLHPFKNSLLMN